MDLVIELSPLSPSRRGKEGERLTKFCRPVRGHCRPLSEENWCWDGGSLLRKHCMQSGGDKLRSFHRASVPSTEVPGTCAPILLGFQVARVAGEVRLPSQKASCRGPTFVPLCL